MRRSGGTGSAIAASFVACVLVSRYPASRLASCCPPCSRRLLFALGRDPVYVMGQLGHTDPAFTLRIYAHAMRHENGDRDALRALVEGVDWAPNGHWKRKCRLQRPRFALRRKRKSPP